MSLGLVYKFIEVCVWSFVLFQHGRVPPVSSCEASMVDSVAASCRLSTGAACLSMLTARAPAYSESFSNDGEGKSGCHGPAVPRCHGSSRMRLQTVQGSA